MFPVWRHTDVKRVTNIPDSADNRMDSPGTFPTQPWKKKKTHYSKPPLFFLVSDYLQPSPGEWWAAVQKVEGEAEKLTKDGRKWLLLFRSTPRLHPLFHCPLLSDSNLWLGLKTVGLAGGKKKPKVLKNPKCSCPNLCVHLRTAADDYLGL